MSCRAASALSAARCIRPVFAWAIGEVAMKRGAAQRLGLAVAETAAARQLGAGLLQLRLQAGAQRGPALAVGLRALLARVLRVAGEAQAPGARPPPTDRACAASGQGFFVGIDAFRLAHQALDVARAFGLVGADPIGRRVGRALDRGGLNGGDGGDLRAEGEGGEDRRASRHKNKRPAAKFRRRSQETERNTQHLILVLALPNSVARLSS